VPDPVRLPATDEPPEETIRREDTIHPSTHEAWPAESDVEARSKPTRGYFQQHPGAKWLLLVAAALLLLGVGFVWHYYSLRESTDDAQVESHIVPVSSRVGGTVLRVNIDDNQLVEAGALLVQLDPTDYKIALDRTKAELADAEAMAQAARTGVPIVSANTASQLASTRASQSSAQKQADAARAQLREAEANYTRVGADLKRMELLVSRDEVSRQQYDAAVANEKAARAGVDMAQAQVSAANSKVAEAQAGVQAAQTAPQQVRVTEARAGSAEAAVEKSKTAVAQAELNLQYTTIRAAVAGIVSKRNVEPGQVIQSGQPLLAIVSLEDVWVTANFKETQLKNVRPGNPVTVHVDAYGRDFKGHVDSIGGATGARFSVLPPENASGNYVKVVQRVPVKIVFEKGENPEHLLRPGMSVVPTVRIR
jgi:membrane fusion protein (multidrug efflux system)